MVVDTSALVAIMLAEPDAERFARALADAPVRLLSAVSRVELSCVSMAGHKTAEMAHQYTEKRRRTRLAIATLDAGERVKTGHTAADRCKPQCKPLRRRVG